MRQGLAQLQTLARPAQHRNALVAVPLVREQQSMSVGAAMGFSQVQGLAEKAILMLWVSG